MNLQEHYKKMLCEISNISTTDFVRIPIGNTRRLDSIRFLLAHKAIEERDEMFRITSEGMTSLEQYGLMANGQLTELGKKYAQSQTDAPTIGLSDSLKPTFKQYLLKS
mgnify:FL=1